MIRRFSVLIALMTLLTSAVHVSAAEPEGERATVSMIIGSAKVYASGAKTGRSLQKGVRLGAIDVVRVAEKSRVELRLPDGSVMRLAEKTKFIMSRISYDKKTEKKNIRTDLGVGKLWAKVKTLTTTDSSVEVKTSNAVAGVRGTVYRVSVSDDQSATVKVYDGSVYVANPPRDASKPAGAATKPHEVSGPHEVPPPYHEVSMQEWTAIVQAMQQITISPQGVPSKPENFDPKADADDWVKWNQERDKQMTF